MKKFFLIVSLLSVVAFFGYSQKISLSNPAGNIVPNSIIIQQGTPDSTELITYINVKNACNDAIQVYCRKTTLSLMDSTQVTFCFAGQCYFATTDESALTEPINPGDSVTDFSSHYTRTEGEEKFESGESVIRWTFFTRDGSDSVSVTIIYKSYPLGIEETLAHQGVLSASIPNPANEKATFTYSIPSGSRGELVIRNLVGSAMKTLSLESTNGKITLATAEMADGIYFCSLVIDGKVTVTKKMLVRH
ncbi:MAG: T9SS type A sorting domain-containing protein [Bacteroidota bacterium]